MIAGGALLAAGAVFFAISIAANINADPDSDGMSFVILPSVGGVLTGAGAASLIAGGIVYSRGKAGVEGQPPPQRPAVRVRPSLRPGHAGLALDIRF